MLRAMHSSEYLTAALPSETDSDAIDVRDAVKRNFCSFPSRSKSLGYLST